MRVNWKLVGSPLHAVIRNAAPVTRCIVASSTPPWCPARRPGSACRDHGNQGCCDEDRAHPPAGTSNRQGEQARADRERKKRGQDNQDDADLGYKRARDREGHVRRTPPAQSAAFMTAAAAAGRSLEQRAARTAVPSPPGPAMDVVLIGSSRIREGLVAEPSPLRDGVLSNTTRASRSQCEATGKPHI